MVQNSKDGIFVYRINKENIVTYVSDNWLSFAQENHGGEKCHPDFVRGQSLWDFIADHETRYIYENIIQKVRESKHCIKIPFRCDSPDKRRFLELSIIPLEGEEIEFQSKIIKIEEREGINFLRNDIARSGEFLRMCSFCKKMAISKEEWVELEIAVAVLKLFENTQLPKISHGVCPSCYKAYMENRDKE